jgi:hypothetical protein
MNSNAAAGDVDGNNKGSDGYIMADILEENVAVLG